MTSINPKFTQAETDPKLRDQKLRNSTLDFVTSLPWYNPYAVTLTLKTGYFSTSCAKTGKFWIALDAHQASKNLRHFLNLLGGATFKKSERRSGAQIRCVAVLEDSRVSPHFHLCLDRPDHITHEKFCVAVVLKWHQTHFGNLEVDLKPCTDVNGWLGYMAKYQTKSAYADSIDWMNLQTSCAV